MTSSRDSLVLAHSPSTLAYDMALYRWHRRCLTESLLRVAAEADFAGADEEAAAMMLIRFETMNRCGHCQKERNGEDS